MDDHGTHCEEALREIERFLDGELDSDLAAAIGRHLGKCRPCGDRAEFQRHLKVLIASKCATDRVPPDLLARIDALIDERGAPTT